ncbi:hypothetical protein QUA42_26985 [Microcoleus sp. Pol11C2]|uniref:hypothetical protein n=1 Tax=Microcoleus sp. Pol11C2 TaxID=3055389 RepID=UPI002FD6C5BF
MAALANDAIISTTVEDALLEILGMVAALQADTTKNPQNRTMITSFTQNELTGAITVALTIPSTVTHTAAGRVANATELFL